LIAAAVLIGGSMKPNNGWWRWPLVWVCGGLGLLAEAIIFSGDIGVIGMTLGLIVGVLLAFLIQDYAKNSN